MASEPPSQPSVPPPPRPLANFGDYLKRGFDTYIGGWQDWIVPMLVCAAVTLAAVLCCYLPLLIVSGPLSCGLYRCGLRALRGQPFSTETLWCGWPAARTSALAWLAVQMAILVPMLVFYGLVFLLQLAVSLPLAAAGGPQGPGPGAAVAVSSMAIMAFWMVAMMLGWAVAMAWMLWLGTRTMFILPLVADRGVDFSTAWTLSWHQTRRGFWELLLLNFVAGFLAMLGMYACYVGVIFTFPLYYTMVGAAYEHRFSPGPSPATAPQSPV